MDRSVAREKRKSQCLPTSQATASANEKKNLAESEKSWMTIADGFPPGVTVDELKQYRKKRPVNLNRPLDNLRVEEGNLNHLKTEYSRRFRLLPVTETYKQIKICKGRSENLEIGREESKMFKPEYREAYQDFPRARPRIYRQESQLQTSKNVPMEFSTEKGEKYAPFKHIERSKLLRQTTALKPEGELFTETETRSKYQAHGSPEKAKPLRRPSNIKIDSFFETITSEQKDKYIAYLSNSKRNLEKRPTELKLEGPLEWTTECRGKYLPPGTYPRATPRKRSTSLKLDGELEFWPEYQKNYVDLPRKRCIVPHPPGAIRFEGDLNLDTEFRSKFIDYAHFDRQSAIKKDNNIQLEGNLEITPEYREKFVNFGRSKSDIIRRSDNLNLEGEHSFVTEKDLYRSSSNLSSSTYMKKKENEKIVSGKTTPSPAPSFFDSKPEYSSQYVDFPRQRPTVTKPRSNLASSGDFENMTEKRSQYQSYGTVPRTSPRRRPANLLLEGGIEGEAEYKSKYIEYPVHVQRTPKPIDALPKQYPSFQVLDVKGKEGCNGSSEPIFPTKPSSPITQPTFRLEVQNMDQQPIGFHRSPHRIFPREAIENHPYSASDKHQAALEAALKRKASYDRQAPKSPREQLDNRFPIRSRIGSANLDENGNDKSFVVLNNTEECFNGEEARGRIWEPPPWMENSAIPQSIQS